MLRKTLSAIAAAATLGMATPAWADAITLDPSNTGSTFSIDYNGFADGQMIDGLSGSALFTLSAATDNSYTFDYAISNTTDGGLSSRISSFAFNTDPQIHSASATGDYAFTVIDSHYPNAIGTVDVCFKGGKSKSCAGNSGGTATGGTGTGSLTLMFANAIDSITLSDFFLRYQSITGAGGVTSASGAGTLTGSTSGGSTSGTPVPEPGMLGLFGAGLLGFGLMRRRRKALVAA